MTWFWGKFNTSKTSLLYLLLLVSPFLFASFSSCQVPFFLPFANHHHRHHDDRRRPQLSLFMTDRGSPIPEGRGEKPASLNPSLIGRLTQSFRNHSVPLTAPLTPAAGGASARLQHALTDLSEAEDILDAYASKIRDLEDVNSIVSGENETLRGKVTSQDDELEILHGELTALRSHNDQLEEILSSLKSRLSMTKIDLASANSALLRIAVVERERESAENSVTKLRRDLEKCRQSLTEVESDRDHAQASLQGAYLELRVAKEKFEKQRDEFLAIQAELADLREEMRDLLEHNERESRASIRLQKENGSLRSSLSDLEREFAEVHQSLRLTQAQIEEGRAKKGLPPSPKKMTDVERVIDLLRPFIKACRMEFEELSTVWTRMGSGIKKDFAEMQTLFEETLDAIKDFRTDPILSDEDPEPPTAVPDVIEKTQEVVVVSADVSKSEPQVDEESEEESEGWSEGEEGEYEEESEEESEGEGEEPIPPKVDVAPPVPPHSPHRKHLPVPPVDSETRISVARNEVVSTKTVNAGCCAPLGNVCPFAFAVETPVHQVISKTPCRAIAVICVLYIPLLILSIVCPPLALFLLNMAVHYGSVDGCCACKPACGRFLYHEKVRICAVLWAMGIIPGIVYSLLQLHVYLISGCCGLRTREDSENSGKELNDIV